MEYNPEPDEYTIAELSDGRFVVQRGGRELECVSNAVLAKERVSQLIHEVGGRKATWSFVTPWEAVCPSCARKACLQIYRSEGRVYHRCVNCEYERKVGVES